MSRVLGHGVGPWKHFVGPATLGAVLTKAGPHSVPPDVDLVQADTTANDVDVNLPLTSDTPVGRCITFVNTALAGANDLNVNAQGGELLFSTGIGPAGAATAPVSPGASFTVKNMGSGRWQVVSVA